MSTRSCIGHCKCLHPVTCVDPHVSDYRKRYTNRSHKSYVSIYRTGDTRFSGRTELAVK